MSGAAYRSTRDEINRFPIPTESGWREISGSHITLSSGFEALSFQRGNEIVISFAGTATAVDWIANTALGAGNCCDQLREAALYYCQVRAQNSNATITLTGHSLGGGLASLIGVFFKENAIAFDPAPFRSAATNMIDGMYNHLVKDDLLNYLWGNSVDEQWLPSIERLEQFGTSENLEEREVLVSYRYVQGEVLSPGDGTFNRIGTPLASLTHGTPDASSIDLHSQALLTAFLEKDAFRKVTFKLPDLLKMIFDYKLYNFPTDEGHENFLERLVRYESGTALQASDTDMLTRFTRDMEKIAQEGSLTMTNTNLTKMLIAFAMQAYYEDDRLTPDQELFDNKGVSGGIHFDRSIVADSLQSAKGYSLYLQDWPLNVPWTEYSKIISLLPELEDWYLQTGSQSMQATAGSKRSFMVGGASGDMLSGANQADLIVGVEGNDILDGGGGGDTLIGGEGVDTYVINTGGGHDTIIDDGRNILVIDGKIFAGVFIKKCGLNSYVFTSDDSTFHKTYTMTFNSPGTLTIDAETSLTFCNQTSVADFADGQFGLTLWENETPTNFDLDLIGTEGTNTSELTYFEGESVVYSYGFFQVSAFNLDGSTSGSWLYSENDLALDTSITLTGGSGNDRLEGLLGADHLVGGEGNDCLWGVSGSLLEQPAQLQQGDWLEGGAGIDLLCGGGGEDMLYGGDDTDILAGMLGKDLLMGERGNDLVVGCTGDDVVSGGAGDDLLVGDGNLTIQAISLNSDPYSLSFVYADGYLTGMQSAEMELDLSFAEDGADRLFGGIGNDCLIGGLGDDLLSGDDDNDILWGDNDATSSSGGADILYGGHGDDILYGAGGSDLLDGGNGADTLSGGEGSDLLYGDGGDDILWGDNPEQGGTGNDILYGGAGNDQLFGGLGDDLYVFSAGDGTDCIEDANGQNIIRFESITSFASLQWMRCALSSTGTACYSEDGQDVLIRVNSGDQVVIKNGMLGSFAFEIGTGASLSWENFAAQVPEYRQYSDADEAITTTDGDDRIFAGGGNDSVHGLTGNDALSGGNGFNEEFVSLLRQIYPWLPAGFSVDWSYEESSTPANENDLLYGDDGNDIVEGGAGNDRLYGGNGDDALWGGVDSDTLYGDDGDDLLYGNADNDRFYGGAGADYLDGGTGIDFVGYIDSSEGVTVDLETGSGLGGDAEGDVLVSIEYLLGSSHADILCGDGNDNHINGGGGQDTLFGGDGDDVLGYFILESYDDSDYNWTSDHPLALDEACRMDGGNGNDTLFGGHYSDILFGGNDNDLLSGGMGHDILRGGEGDDVLVSGTTYETPDTSYCNILEGGAGDDIYQPDCIWGGVNVIDDEEGSNVVQLIDIKRAPDLASFNVGFTTVDMDQLSSIMTIDWRDSLEAEDQLRQYSLEFSQSQTWCPPAMYQDLYIAYNGGLGGVATVIRGGRNPELDFTYEFANGEVYSHAELLEQVMARYQSPYYGDDDDHIVGENWGNLFWAGGGDDTISGGAGDDTFYGQGGSDFLYGNAGDDVLEGGLGNDCLQGGSGKDTYLFNQGDGQDVLVDFDLASSFDTLLFGEGICAAAILAVKMQGEQNDLILFFQNSTDQIRIAGYFDMEYEGEVDAPYNGQVERFTFADGTVWNASDIDDHVVENHAPEITGSFPELQSRVGEFFSFVIPGDVIIDPDSWDTLSYEIGLPEGNALPTWLHFDPASRTLSGTPDEQNLGHLELVVSVQDRCGVFAQQELVLDILPLNRAPESVIPLPDMQSTWGQLCNSTIASGSFVDPDGDVLAYSATLADGTPLPAWLIFNPLAQTFTGVPFSLETINVRVSATDGDGATASDVFELRVVNQPTLSGDSGSDTLRGSCGNDVIWGLAGNDILRGGAGADLLDGGDGIDTADYRDSDAAVLVDLSTGAAEGGTAEGDMLFAIENIFGSPAADSLTGSSVRNVLVGYGGNDLLFGLAGNDVLRGEDGADSLFGGAGNDVLRGGMGADKLDGGDGTDTADYRDSVDGVTVNLATGKAYRGTAAGDTLLSIEKILGSDAHDSLIGSTGRDVLIGNGGNDLLFGAAGNDLLQGGDGTDVLLGGPGDDVLRGGAGFDLLIGGAGTDTADYRDAGRGVTVNLLIGFATDDKTNDDILLAIEKVHGSNNSDSLIGSFKNDILCGNDGDDTLAGGLGSDILAGGEGRDVFLFNSSIHRRENVDILRDMVSGEDRIWLDRDTFVSLTAEGPLSPSFFAANATGCALDADDYILYNTASGALFYDSDGVGPDGAVKFATLTGKPDISANDFLVVA